MPIGRLLADGDFTDEQLRVLKQAFADTLRRLGLVDRNDPVCEIVAGKIIDAGKTDCSDAASLTEEALKHFQI